MERIVLQAAEGMVYTDGTCGGKIIYLAQGQTADGWYQIPEAEYLQELEQGFDDAVQEDYQAALREFGVNV